MKTPEQNGVAERSNGLVQEGLRSMLLYSKLGKSFWSHAARTKIYTLNRTLTKATGKTPFEVLLGRKPRVNHLRVFGASGFAKDLKPGNGKLSARGVPCIMLGYAEKQKV